MPFRGVGEIGVALDEGGAVWDSWIHKSSAPTPGAAGQWGDLSMGAGIPKYNAYVGSQYEATALTNNNNSAIYCGATPTSGSVKHLIHIGLQTTAASQAAPLSWLLCDYLMFYPLIDGDSGDVQEFTQTNSLPRYITGEGVQAFLVTTSPMNTNGAAVITYTNSDGTPGRTTTIGMAASSSPGALAHRVSTTVQASTCSPFIPLANGDRGIRSIENIQLTVTTGGFLSLVLCKPLSSILLREAQTWTEKCTLQNQGGQAPKIEDGAFLNFLFSSGGTRSPALVRGCLTFAWS